MKDNPSMQVLAIKETEGTNTTNETIILVKENSLEENILMKSNQNKHKLTNS